MTLAILALLAFQQPSWDALKTPYQIDPHVAINVKATELGSSDSLGEHLSFVNHQRERVTGIFKRPPGSGPFACVLLLHGMGANKEDLLKSIGGWILQKGIAVLALDAKHHGERANVRNLDVEQIDDTMMTSVVEYRMVLDYLNKRGDVDMQRIGLIGYSMGGWSGAILAGVDSRIQASVLCVSCDSVIDMIDGLPVSKRLPAHYIAPSNYVGHIAPRAMLMINGRNDPLTRPENVRRMFDAAGEPKELIWASSDHHLPASVMRRGVEWLVQKLAKPVKQTGS